ncbi:Uncharacterized protein Fot_37663 [Forsythia ovata]|uniref:Uncharacterized protein n=1 Tax=Forsythia ovata TaxID=205694 RepID=A0ABD1S0D0_9LAMI
MVVMRSCVISHMSEGLSRRKIEDIEKVLAVYNRKVLTIEDSLVKACKRMVIDLEVVEDEKSKEIHHLKKKNSSLLTRHSFYVKSFPQTVPMKHYLNRDGSKRF